MARPTSKAFTIHEFAEQLSRAMSVAAAGSSSSSTGGGDPSCT